MFTGIVTAIGTVRRLQPIGQGQDMGLEIATPWPDAAAIPLGASIACSGCCLTVTATTQDSFWVQASAETLSLTTLSTWRTGTRLNLERALRMGDELGGHIVSGHVDGLAELAAADAEHGSQRWRLRAPPALARFIATKGSVTLDGVSLTVNAVHGNAVHGNAVHGNAVQGNAVDGADFTINLIAHTLAHTTLGDRRPGERLNLEIDMLARYVARLAESP